MPNTEISVPHCAFLISKHGVPKTVMSDNDPQFASKEFEAFASQYCFNQIMSSPRYPQRNAMIERMVQTVKQYMQKCAEARHDPYLAMLIYRATCTPLSNSIPSPAELLNGRKYRVPLPTRTLMQSSHEQIVQEQMIMMIIIIIIIITIILMY